MVRPPARVSRGELLRGNVIGCLTAVYDSAVFGRVEMPPVRRRQDYGLWLRLLRPVPYAHGLPEPLADYRVAPPRSRAASSARRRRPGRSTARSRASAAPAPAGTSPTTSPAPR